MSARSTCWDDEDDDVVDGDAGPSAATRDPRGWDDPSSDDQDDRPDGGDSIGPEGVDSDQESPPLAHDVLLLEYLKSMLIRRSVFTSRDFCAICFYAGSHIDTFIDHFIGIHIDPCC